MTKRIDGRTRVCLLIGDPVERSLSPLLHNAGYRALEIDHEFVFAAVQVKEGDLARALDGIRSLNIRGVSCTMPHKRALLEHLDELDETAQAIGAVNTIVNENGRLCGCNTDWCGVVHPLERLTDLAGKKVAVFGAGGAARAACYGLSQRRARISIINRSAARAKELADEFGATVVNPEEADLIPEHEVLVNCTSVGMAPMESESPVPLEDIRPHHLVFDAVYQPHETVLLRHALDVGAGAVHGIEMLLHQGAKQFELFTGYAAPLEKMRTAALIACEERAHG